jgi:hypothetical protein
MPKSKWALLALAGVGAVVAAKKLMPKPDPEPQYLTVEDAVKMGVIDIAAIQKAREVPQNLRIMVLTPDRDAEQWYPTWNDWRNHHRAKYLGGDGHLTRFQMNSGVRAPIMDLSAGVPVEDYNAAKGFALDEGFAKGPEEEAK